VAQLRKNWWWIRLFILSFALVAIGWYLFHSTPWRKRLGIQPTYTEQITEGDQIVKAIRACQQRTGLWPQYLEDLKLPPQKFSWFYELQNLPEGHRQPALSFRATGEGERAHLAYMFAATPAEEMWIVFGSGIDRTERPTGVPATSPTITTATPSLDATLTELDHRIAREPTILRHRQDKISLLVLRGRAAEAQTAIDAAIHDLPNAAWPRLARAAIALQGTTTSSTAATSTTTPALPTDVTAYVDWAAARPSLTRLFGTHVLFRQMHDPVRAAAAVKEALAQPVEVDDEDEQIAAFYLWDMARWALETSNWDLALQIANRWEAAVADKKVVDTSYLGIRAAAEAAQGNAPAASADLAALQNAGDAWAHDPPFLTHLSEALSSKSSPHLELPTHPTPFRIFVKPE